jgi:6-phosphogluconolactonase
VRLDLRVCNDVNALGAGVAAHVAEAIGKAVRRRGTCSLVLSGGNTPRPLYERLAQRFRDTIPWAHVHVFWADERYVPADDPLSNAGMARALMLDHVPCPADHVHPMPTSCTSPAAAARQYEDLLRAHFHGESPRFDVAILGLGREGHTASVFAGSPAIAESERWVLAVSAPIEPATRLTLTLPVLTHAALIEVLVSGSAKADALAHLRQGTADVNAWPAVALRSASRRLTVWADREAATMPDVATR